MNRHSTMLTNRTITSYKAWRVLATDNIIWGTTHCLKLILQQTHRRISISEHRINKCYNGIGHSDALVCLWRQHWLAVSPLWKGQFWALKDHVDSPALAHCDPRLSKRNDCWHWACSQEDKQPLVIDDSSDATPSHYIKFSLSLIQD